MQRARGRDNQRSEAAETFSPVLLAVVLTLGQHRTPAQAISCTSHDCGFAGHPRWNRDL